jgi:RNA polymerase sigma-70 factor (ECF subfamily)
MIDEDFTAIYDLHQGSIARYCVCKCRDRDISQDLTQETFFRYWQCLQRKEEILNVRAFLYRIAHNLFVDHVRKKKEASLDLLLEAGFEPILDPWPETYSRLDAERPLKKIVNMRQPYKKVLHQRFILGFTPAEIAMMSGENANTISARIFRALKLLRMSTGSTALERAVI